MSVTPTVLPTALANAPAVTLSGLVVVKAPTSFQRQTMPSGANMVFTTMFAMKNVSPQVLYMTVTSVPSNPSPLSSMLPQESSTVTFYPGSVWVFPTPPSGQQWAVSLITRKTARAIVNDAGHIAGIIGVLAIYGGYELIKQRKTIFHRIGRWLG